MPNGFPSSSLALPGVAARSFAGYLKGLGILRVWASQTDAEASAWWDHRNMFHLSTTLSESDLVQFFAESYAPSPIVSPWNKDGGFGPDGRPQRAALAVIASSQTPRLAEYRNTIIQATRIKSRYPEPHGSEAAIKRAKAQFVAALRSELPDAALDWIDVCWAIRGSPHGAELVSSPLAGAGGNDGRLDFSSSYAEAVVTVLQLESAAYPTATMAHAALFGGYGEGGLLTDVSPGLYDPGALGGPNGTSGDAAGHLANPWDVVLAMEGLLVWGGSSVRHLRAVRRARGAFPFTFTPSAGGAGVTTIEAADSTEAWTPLWNHPASYSEIQQLFREGRTEWNRRQATGAADVARAVRALGVQRGVAVFVRYTLPKRNGQYRLAVPLGNFPVTEQADRRVVALEQLDGWLSTLDRALGSKSTWPASLKSPRKRVDDHLLAYCADGRRQHLQDLLWSLVDIERAAALHVDAFEGAKDPVPLPLPLLHPSLLHAFDLSPALELALAWASQRGSQRADPNGSSHLVPTARSWMEPVARVNGRWVWSSGTIGGTLRHLREREDYPALVLERLLWGARTSGVAPDGEHTGSTDAWRAARPVTNLNLLMPLVISEPLYRQFRQFLALAVLFDYRQPDQFPIFAPTRLDAAHPLLALFKAVTQPVGLSLLPRGSDSPNPTTAMIRVPPEPQIIHLLLSGNLSQIRQAANLATRRVFASGIPVPMSLAEAAWTLTPQQSRRMASVLSIPLAPTTIVRALTTLWPDDSASGAEPGRQAGDPLASASHQ